MGGKVISYPFHNTFNPSYRSFVIIVGSLLFKI